MRNEFKEIVDMYVKLGMSKKFGIKIATQRMAAKRAMK